jgi:hypothetical protein
MARAGDNGARTAAKGAKPSKPSAKAAAGSKPSTKVQVAKSSGKVNMGAAPKVRRTKPEPEPIDLKAALPWFLARIAIFVVIAAVLWVAVGLNPLLAVLFGLIGGAFAGYPLARVQKRVSREGDDKPRS